MTDASDHVANVSTSGRTETYLPFAEDIDGLPGDEQELVLLLSRLDKSSASYGMETTGETTKLMTNNINGVNKKINVANPPIIRSLPPFSPHSRQIYLHPVLSSQSRSFSSPSILHSHSIGSSSTVSYNSFQGCLHLLKCA